MFTKVDGTNLENVGESRLSIIYSVSNPAEAQPQ